MQKKIPSAILIGVLLVALIGSAFLFYRVSFFKSTKDKIYSLLHLKKVQTENSDSTSLQSSDLLKKYYDQFGYEQHFTDSSHVQSIYRDMLIEMLYHADSLGLDPKDYHADYLEKYDALSRLPNFDYAKYEAENEIIFSDAAISFLYHTAYGKEIDIEFNGVKYSIDSTHILNLFSNLLVHHNWRSTLDSLEPKIPQYLILKDKLNHTKAFLNDFPETDTLTVSNTAGGKISAAIKLGFFGFISDTLVGDSSDDLRLRAALVGFQKMMCIDTSGKLDTKTIAALNLPLSNRIEQIKSALNYWRWTGRLAEKEFILVNIPAARLQIVNQDSAKDLTMRVVVGKVETQTPSFTAYITRVITYPYWTVPLSVATEEMLPKIKKRLAYLDENNLQVLDAKGNILDPANISWKKYSKKYFPFTIRQSTGCDNALGVLKFDLNSPFSIYLHDTNRRDLFSRNSRFMSHGCVRLEKPMELANYVLGSNLDSASVEKLNMCLKNEEQKEFYLKKKFPVLIFYMPADIDADNLLKFYNDIYKKEEVKVES